MVQGTQNDGAANRVELHGEPKGETRMAVALPSLVHFLFVFILGDGL